MREIITLQFGPVANYTGTHFWNIQDESRINQISDHGNPQRDYNIIYREGINYRKERTFVPRLLIFEKKGNLGGFRRENALYYKPNGNPSHSLDTWGNSLEVHAQPAPKKNPYIQALDNQENALLDNPEGENEADLPENTKLTEEDIRTWSDFNGVYYHPKSVHTLSGIEHGNSLGELETFIEGAVEFEEGQQAEDIVEGNFRSFCEECDQLQGFQVMADAYGGFGGYSSKFIEACRDEYPKTPVFLFSMSAYSRSKIPEYNWRDIPINTASTMENVSLFTPLYVPEKDALDKLENSWYNNFSSLYGIGGFYSVLIDAILQPLINKTTDLSNIVNTLTKAGPNILSSRLGIFLENGLETNTDINSQTLPLLALKKINQPAVTVFGEAVFTRGLGKSASNSWTSSVFSSDSYLKLPHTFSTLSSPLQNTTSQYRNINEAKAVSVAALLKNSTEVESYISELCDSLDVKDKIYKQYDPDLIIQYKESLVALKDRYLLD